MHLAKLIVCSCLLIFALLASGQLYADSPNRDWALGLHDEGRPDADKARDAGRKPVQVVEFWGIKPGMRVLDMFAFGGYYTEVFSNRVGEKGEVLSHNLKSYLEQNEGRLDKQVSERLADNRLPNVKRLDLPFGAPLDLENEIDAATIILNYHDLYVQANKDQRMGVLVGLHKALKPGGIFGIVDAEANAGEHDKDLHRIHNETVKAEIIAAGFKLTGESDVLSNPDDDHTLPVFDPSIRGKTDRFVLKFTK